MTTTQCQEILEYLMSGNTLTSLEALEKFGCFRLASRVSDLKREGFIIKSEMVKGDNGKHYARYWIEKKKEQLTLGV